MDIDEGLGERANRLAYQRADRQVGHVMVVHHVEMHEVGAGGDHVLHFLAQPGKIGRQYAGSDARVFRHVRVRERGDFTRSCVPR
ncbi:hypothetical protein D3C83_59490 [compost metagenome]